MPFKKCKSIQIIIPTFAMIVLRNGLQGIMLTISNIMK